MTIHEILERLEGVKSSNGKYTAKCPAHDDSRPSLSIAVGDDGRVLLKCHAACSTEDIVGSMGLSMTDLFPESDMSPRSTRHGKAGRRTRPKTRVVRLGSRQDKYLEMGRLAAEYNVVVDISELQDLADELGVSVQSLMRLRTGWSQLHRAWSFPMHDVEGRVRGIRLRTWAGQKFSVKGGRDGLFVPVRLGYEGLLLACEGPTDTAALLDTGFEAVGRPNCTGGVRQFCELVRRKKPEGVVIVADVDSHGAGQRGAEALASAVLVYSPSVRVIRPPDGVKDARAWLRAGATHEDVDAVIAAAPIRTLKTKGGDEA